MLCRYKYSNRYISCHQWAYSPARRIGTTHYPYMKREVLVKSISQRPAKSQEAFGSGGTLPLNSCCFHPCWGTWISVTSSIFQFVFHFLDVTLICLHFCPSPFCIQSYLRGEFDRRDKTQRAPLLPFPFSLGAPAHWNYTPSLLLYAAQLFQAGSALWERVQISALPETE